MMNNYFTFPVKKNKTLILVLQIFSCNYWRLVTSDDLMANESDLIYCLLVNVSSITQYDRCSFEK